MWKRSRQKATSIKQSYKKIGKEGGGGLKYTRNTEKLRRHSRRRTLQTRVSADSQVVLVI